MREKTVRPHRKKAVYYGILQGRMEEDRLERQTILIVDDSEMNRMMLTEILGAHYQYIEAENGRQAIHLLQKNLMVDLILLDIHMPEMDGFQVLEQLNRAQWMDEIPVIMISAEDSGETIKRAYSMGVTDYIQRPFDAFIVRRRIENTLKLYANQKRLMKLVSDQIYEKEENNNLMVGILNHVVEFRTHEGEEYNRNIRSATELLLRRLIQKTDSYHLSEEDIVLIKMASAIRNIGKIGLPDSVLNTSGKLTQEEFAIFKTHTTAGAEILEQMSFGKNKPLFRYALEICRWHHERWDGNGYPDGLRGEEIPISAQVVALADVYDALTTNRKYRKAIDHDTAITRILRGECGAFNPLLLECLLDISSDLRMAATFKGRNPYRFEVDRLSDEILAHADVPRNDRVQRLLESMQERMDFFAACSGGLQFEYDVPSKLADITDWSEAPQYRRWEINLSQPNGFTRLSHADLQRTREALAATTKENPEFSISLLLPYRDEYRWYNLRMRSLWSDAQPERYVGVIGQMTDSQTSDGKPVMLTAEDDRDNPAMAMTIIRRLESLFDIVRLVDPIANTVLELDEQGVLRKTQKHCAAFWDNDSRCANCISARAFEQKTTLNKLEFTSTDMYFVLSKYLCLNGTPCVLEMLSKLNEGRWIDANGTRLLLERSRGENIELFMDSLTKVYSRRYFETYRTHLEGMECVTMIDVNHFKHVNDTFGHPAGDAVLRDIAAAIRSAITPVDILIRFGGDEFLLLCPRMSREDFEKKSEEIQAAVRGIVIPEYPELHLSVSIGGVCGVHPLADAIRAADLRMYEDKKQCSKEDER